ncbi:hypothetical protein [Malaciobacter mytili]|uniref:hypothetical protein n=1 Tax=Malaciobacter mytili TaxID=603050 RepID=UPI003A85AB79
MSFYFLIHNIKFKRWLILFSPLLVYITWVLLLIFFNITSAMDNDKLWKNAIAIVGAIFPLIVREIILPLMIIIYVFKYMRNKSLFSIFYFLFSIFYFLFFIFYFLFFIHLHHLTQEISPIIMYSINITSLIFSIVFIIYIFLMGKKILRYLFAFLAAVSNNILLFIYIFEGDTTKYINFNQHYGSKLILITLTFFIIQLLIEAYYVYKKEKLKWQRFKRMQEYKQRKKNNE